MSHWLESLRENFDSCCFANQCSKENCSVLLTDTVQPQLIVDFDKPGSPIDRNKTRCDYLVAAESESGARWVAILEFKSGKKFRNTKLGNQLSASARAMESRIPYNSKIFFRPVLASNGLGKSKRFEIRRNKVNFHEHEYPIRLISCGDKLSKAFNEY